MKVGTWDIRKWLLLGLLIVLGIGNAAWLSPSEVGAAETSGASSSLVKFSDTDRHWAQEAIGWGVANKIVNGYEDGTFRPDRVVTEAEFLALLLRAFPVTNSGYAESLSPWYGIYFTYAAGQNWPVVPALANEPYSRGEAARLIAATQAQSLPVDGAIEFLLLHGLAQGKTAATVEGFGKYDTLTRAESLQFIRNLVNKKLTLSAAPPGNPADSGPQVSFAVRGVTIGDFESTVVNKLGQPQRKDASEYGFQWYIYNSDYANYAQIGMQNGQVVALFSNAVNWSTDTGIRTGSTGTELANAYGEPMKYMTKGNTRFSMSDTDKEPTYERNGSFVTFFIDLHDDKKVTAMQVIDKGVEYSKPGYYGSPSEELRIAYEKELLDLANVARARVGKRAYTWDDKIADTARKHSKDMADNDFFAHKNLAGQSPFDRMRADGILYSRAAENIAAGQTSAIFAHSGWMNSDEGHREAILGDTVRLGVGVYFGGSMKIYYTQNFYTPR
ncbi:CAP-associated domain-containing protein [Paenibacillus koleovorans]|uniref:CAP-associated domain-containing protein n=1 Tax=Paenibacillus koleovorans TaxID=121608 RepID=UPI0013E3DC48|nr:CAP-associated domain-containing protein [Paenibacillus koleovorans]